MATTKAKKPVAKKAPAKKPAAKKTAVKRSSPSLLTMNRNDEYTQLTWVLVCIWLVLIAIFLATVIGKWG
ncbi:MAG: hypothetical protein ACREGB_02865 [Candidatus Saccharimonadales bacterium]